MLDGHEVIAQGRIYQERGRAEGAPPVPAVALLCEDASVLGAPFYAMQRVPGEAVHDTQLQDWFTGAADSFRERICREWVSAFAGLAGLAPLVAAAAGPLGAASPLSGLLRTPPLRDAGSDPVRRAGRSGAGLRPAGR